MSVEQKMYAMDKIPCCPHREMETNDDKARFLIVWVCRSCGRAYSYRLMDVKRMSSHSPYWEKINTPEKMRLFAVEMNGLFVPEYEREYHGKA